MTKVIIEKETLKVIAVVSDDDLEDIVHDDNHRAKQEEPGNAEKVNHQSIHKAYIFLFLRQI